MLNLTGQRFRHEGCRNHLILARQVAKFDVPTSDLSQQQPVLSPDYPLHRTDANTKGLGNLDLAQPLATQFGNPFFNLH